MRGRTRAWQPPREGVESFIDFGHEFLARDAPPARLGVLPDL